MATDPQPDQSSADQATYAALVVLLLSDAPIDAVTSAARALLAPLGILPEATAASLALLYAHVGKPEVHPPNTALAQVARTEWVRRAVFVVDSARRITVEATSVDKRSGWIKTPLTPDPARDQFGRNVRDRIANVVQDPLRPTQDTSPLDRQLVKERTYLAQHLNAVRARREAALRVDQEAARLKTPILGWYAINDSRTTPECAAASGKNFEVARPPSIGFPGTPHGGTCFPAGTLVAGAGAVASSARRYVGEVVELRTRAGRHMTVTPNHPILTAQGWVAAGLIEEGDYVVGCFDPERVALKVDPDDHQVPALIEDVAETLGGSPVVIARSVPTAAKDFHGDGLDGEVHVVRTHGFLRDGVDPVFVVEPGGEQGLGGRHEDLLALAGERSFALVLERGSTALLLDDADALGEFTVATDGVVCGPRVAQVLFRRARGHHQAVRRGAVTDAFASLGESSCDHVAADPVGVRERVDRAAVAVLGGDYFDRQVDPGDVRGASGRFGHSPGLGVSALQAAFREGAAESVVPDAGDPSGLVEYLAGEVELDRVVEVGRRAFDGGHVYNYETRLGWYIAQGLIVHNCRCRPGPMHPGAASVDAVVRLDQPSPSGAVAVAV